MSRRPKLLYLAHPFFPAQMIACVRTWNTAKHLATFGWDVTVVTPHPSKWLNPEMPEKVEADAKAAGIRRILTGHLWPMLAPWELRWHEGRLAWDIGRICRRVAHSLGLEAQIGWFYSVKRACCNLMPSDVDVILATAKPNIAFLAARWLGRRLNRPFVLDYRDPWTGDPHSGNNTSSGLNFKEAQLMRECAAVTVVSSSWAELIGSSFGVSEKIHVVSNGFDPAMFVGVRPAAFDHIAIVYAGTLYPPKRILDPVLKAFGILIKRHPTLRTKFHYYGDHAESVGGAAVQLGIKEHVVIHGCVSRAEALSAQKGASVVVVIASVGEEQSLSDKGIVTGKIFDCFALGRPIMAIAPEGSDLRDVVETAGGGRCFTGSDIHGMADYMTQVAGGSIPPFRNPAAYIWSNIAKKMDSCLRSCIPI